jgi:lipid-binding SYLF domain-containing protein
VSNPFKFFSISVQSCIPRHYNSVLRILMKKPLCVVFLVSLSFGLLFAESAAERAESAATVLNEIMAAPDKGIPDEVLGSAKCVAVVPSLLKGGFLAGAAHGRGIATCRTANGWSAPAPFSINGGSFGFQIGVQAVDLVMLIMNDRGMQALLSSQFKLGADASAAGGPVGRHAGADTDWKMRAEVLTYSRARGLFAGVTINGAVVHQDEDATRQIYGRMVPFKTILTGAVPTPQGGEPFVAAVRKVAGDPTSTTPAAARPPVPVNPPAVTPVSAPAPAPAAPTTEAAPAAAPAPAPSPAPNQAAPAATPPPSA